MQSVRILIDLVFRLSDHSYRRLLALIMGCVLVHHEIVAVHGGATLLRRLSLVGVAPRRVLKAILSHQINYGS